MIASELVRIESINILQSILKSMVKDSFDICSHCGAPIVNIVVRGPSPAEEVAHPCGHHLHSLGDHAQ